MAGPKPLVHDLENRARRRSPKAIFAGTEYEGQPALIVTEDEAVLVGDKTNVVRVDPTFGVQLGGKLSLSATPEQIALGGGYWRLNPLLLTCLPSTTPTPIPTLVKSTPALLDGKKHFDRAEQTLLSYSDAR